MAAVKNVVEKAKAMNGKIPKGYDLTIPQMREIKEKAEEPWWDVVFISFNFGFLQGMKAAKAAAKKAGKGVRHDKIV